MCSFTVLGRSENQSVSGVTTICLTQYNTSPLQRVDQVVDCGLWNVGPLLFNGSAKLLDIGRNLNMLSYTPIQSIPNMLNGWHVRWVCWPCKNWDVFSFQELCTDPCNMGPCIIMLQHEVMVVDEWHNNGPQDLVMNTSPVFVVHNIRLPIPLPHRHHGPLDPQRWHQQTSHPYMLSAICPVKWKPGFILEENTSLKVPDAIECEHLPTQVGYDDELQSGQDPDELPWDGFWQFVQKLFGFAHWLLQQLSGWLVSDDLES